MSRRKKRTNLAQSIMLTGAVVGVTLPTIVSPLVGYAEETSVNAESGSSSEEVEVSSDTESSSEGELNRGLFDSGALSVLDEALAEKLGKGVEAVVSSDYTDANLGLIDELDVSGRGLKSLSGFEKLSGLVTLNASDNELSGFDELAGMSDHVTDLDVSDNLIFVTDEMYAEYRNVKLEGNFAIQDTKYPDVGNKIVFNAQEILKFEGGSDELDVFVSNLVRYDRDVLDDDRIGKQLAKLAKGGMSLGIDGEDGKFYDVSYNALGRVATIRDLGKQPARDVTLTVRVGDRAIRAGVVKPRALSNVELKDPVERVWHNNYGLSLYETRDKRVFYSMDYEGNGSKMYELKGVVGGIKSVELREGNMALIDGADDLYVMDDTYNNGDFDPSRGVMKLGENVKAFSLGEMYNTYGIYEEDGLEYDRVAVLLKTDGSLVKKGYTTDRVAKKEYAMTSRKFSNVYENEEAFSRYGRMMLTLVGEDGKLYDVDARMNVGLMERDVDGFTFTGSAEMELPFSDEEIAGVYKRDEYGYVVSLKDGRSFEVTRSEYGTDLGVKELAIRDVVDAKADVILTSSGELYANKWNEDYTEKTYEKLVVGNVKKIVTGYEVSTERMYYVTRDGALYFDADMYDVSPGYLVDESVEDITYLGANGVIAKKADGTYKLFNAGWDGTPDGFSYVDYDVSYLGLGQLPIEVDPVDPTPTDPEDGSDNGTDNGTEDGDTDPVVDPPVDPTPTEPTDPTDPTDPVIDNPTGGAVDPVVPPVVTPGDLGNGGVIEDGLEEDDTDEVIDVPDTSEADKPKPDTGTTTDTKKDDVSVDVGVTNPTGGADTKKDETVGLGNGDVDTLTDESSIGNAKPREGSDSEVGKNAVDKKAVGTKAADTKAIKEDSDGGSKERLPQTGENVPVNTMGIGIGAALVGFWLLLTGRKKRNTEK